MYRDLWEVYWLNGMKRDIVEFLANCPNCQQVKVEMMRIFEACHLSPVCGHHSGI